jgi:hypothetical protein
VTWRRSSFENSSRRRSYVEDVSSRLRSVVECDMRLAQSMHPAETYYFDGFDLYFATARVARAKSDSAIRRRQRGQQLLECKRTEAQADPAEGCWNAGCCRLGDRLAAVLAQASNLFSELSSRCRIAAVIFAVKSAVQSPVVSEWFVRENEPGSAPKLPESRTALLKTE